MPKRSRKSKKAEPDINQLAAQIVAKTTGQPPAPADGKNPAAVALGRLGGLKGGKARDNKLSSERKREIAVSGAKARWAKRLPKR